MSARTGKGIEIRAAAEFAIVDTWYVCDALKLIGNRIKLYVTAAVASPGNIEFKIEHSMDGGATWFDACAAHCSPRVFGPLKFSAIGAKSISMARLDQATGENIRISFRATTNAASATIAISALTHESAVEDAIDEIAGYVQANNAIRTTETSPLDTRVDPVSLLDDTNIAAATHYYPSSSGAEMAPYQALSLTGKFIDADGTMTLTVEASNDEDGATADWKDVTKSFLDENLNTETHASYTVTNGTLIFAISIKRANWTRYRVKMINDGATNTGIIKARRTAL